METVTRKQDRSWVPMEGLSQEAGGAVTLRAGGESGAPAEQAYRILQAGFIAAPTIAGLDKFFHRLTDWDQYLAPQIAKLLPVSGHTFMKGVGVVEVAAGLLVAARPRLGGYVVGAWLGGIIVNLLVSRRYLDVALRDFGLMLGAISLSKLALTHDRRPARAA